MLTLAFLAFDPLMLRQAFTSLQLFPATKALNQGSARGSPRSKRSPGRLADGGPTGGAWLEHAAEDRGGGGDGGEGVAHLVDKCGIRLGGEDSDDAALLLGCEAEAVSGVGVDAEGDGVAEDRGGPSKRVGDDRQEQVQLRPVDKALVVDEQVDVVVEVDDVEVAASYGLLNRGDRVGGVDRDVLDLLARDAERVKLGAGRVRVGGGHGLSPLDNRFFGLSGERNR